MFTQELDPANPDSSEAAGGEIISLKQQAGNPDLADLSTRVTLLSGYPSTSTEHTVGDLHFDAQGKLLASTGDGADLGVLDGQAMVAEDLDDLRGKILRIDPNTGTGRPRQPVLTTPANPARCARRCSRAASATRTGSPIDPDDGTVYVGDVGWNTWEMFERVPHDVHEPRQGPQRRLALLRGRRRRRAPAARLSSSRPRPRPTCQAIYSPAEGGTGAGESAPLYAYRHDDPGGENGSAITAGPKYVGTSNYPAQYVGQLFIGDYARDRFQTVDPDHRRRDRLRHAGRLGQPRRHPDRARRQRRVPRDQHGRAPRDRLHRARTTCRSRSASAVQTSSATAPFTAQFIGSGSSDADPGDTLTYDWDFQDGTADSHQVNPAHTLREGRLLRRHPHRLRRPSRWHRRDRPLDRRRQHAADDRAR